ncbi:hypothetical protein [Jeotgalibacillus sp. R-1-5s-1]|uniref:hypothetical protein n=1 Tax=Jeotgalibacillus sp. R-1-5s-1 TaxID=2555897 RepID=UPI00141B1C93|nr:hypothetical protein [Jeotgalibacillus sp. R-1-5s-1]
MKTNKEWFEELCNDFEQGLDRSLKTEELNFLEWMTTSLADSEKLYDKIEI